MQGRPSAGIRQPDGNRPANGIRPVLWALLLLCITWSIRDVAANDLQITNTFLHPHSGGFGEVEFDISWQNSWRTSTGAANWDAAWVFCKLSRNGGAWQHLNLATTGHTIPAGVSTSLGLADTETAFNASTNPAVGIFLFRSANGTGTFTASDIRLQWNYADNGALSGDTIVIRVYAVEMVYVPQGAFSAGDTSSTNTFRRTSTAGSAPWSITSEAAITTEATGPNWYYPGPGAAAGSVFTIGPAFPKGYAPFYIMKGEISQGQWVAFFNTLSSTGSPSQKSARDITSGPGKSSDGLVNRNNVSWVSGDATLPDLGGGATYATTAMNWVGWDDITAYLDWSGLRPMSELEFEKACRGTAAAVAGEYCWGSTSYTSGTHPSPTGVSTERMNPSTSNANLNIFGGPTRVGGFAKGQTTRLRTGAGFYGAMELTGNSYERATVCISNATGRNFQGRYHGNGVLTAAGIHNVTSWPVTAGANAIGSCYKGGTWDNVTDFGRTSDRSIAAVETAARNQSQGGRGVRSQPP